MSTVLVLGGTSFLGRALVDAARANGDEVTLFNRARTNPGLFPDLETIVGDRTGELTELADRAFDIVLDVAAYDPAVVRRSVDVLGDRVGRYVFVSTVSVYADASTPQDEAGEVAPLRDDMPPDEAYGARKAVAEAMVLGAYGDRALIARPGLIVGPNDRTDRFAYWPRRMAEGGRVLAPGSPDDPQQFIDVRDLAEWIVRAYTAGMSGVYNLTGVPLPLSELLSGSQAAAGTDVELVWVDTPTLLAAGVAPWMGVPMWIAAPGCEAINDIIVDKALAAGLTFRPLAVTLADTLAWDLGRGGPAEEGLTRSDEARLLELAG